MGLTEGDGVYRRGNPALLSVLLWGKLLRRRARVVAAAALIVGAGGGGVAAVAEADGASPL